MTVNGKEAFAKLLSTLKITKVHITQPLIHAFYVNNRTGSLPTYSQVHWQPGDACERVWFITHALSKDVGSQYVLCVHGIGFPFKEGRKGDAQINSLLPT